MRHGFRQKDDWHTFTKQHAFFFVWDIAVLYYLGAQYLGHCIAAWITWIEWNETYLSSLVHTTAAVDIKPPPMWFSTMLSL